MSERASELDILASCQQMWLRARIEVWSSITGGRAQPGKKSCKNLGMRLRKRKKITLEKCTKPKHRRQGSNWFTSPSCSIDLHETLAKSAIPRVLRTQAYPGPWFRIIEISRVLGFLSYLQSLSKLKAKRWLVFPWRYGRGYERNRIKFENTTR